MTKASLYSLQPRNYSIIVFGSILANIGLLLYSDLGISAQVLSNQDSRRRLSDSPRRLSEGGGCGGVAAVNGSCHANDTAIASALDLTGLVTHVTECVTEVGILILNDPGRLGQCMVDEYNFTSPCGDCFTAVGSCATGNCLVDCIGGASDDCVECVDQNCVVGLLSCSGFAPFEGSIHGEGAVAYPPSPPAGRLEVTSIGVDGEITYFYGVRRAIQGNAYGIAIAIIACSGVWPYLSLMLFFTAWVKPMSARGRLQWLAWTNRFDRWALMDVLVVCILVAYFNVDVFNGSLSLRTEARSAICTFAISGLWSIVLGTWIMRQSMSAELLAKVGVAEKQYVADGDLIHIGCCGAPSANAESKLHSPIARAALALFSTLTFVMMVVSCTGPIAKLALRESDGCGGIKEEFSQMNVWQIGAKVFPASIEYDHTDPPPAGFTSTIFFLFGIGSSLVCTGTMAAGALLSVALGSGHRHAILLTQLSNALQPYAAYDVLTVATLVTTKEYKLIITAIASSALGVMPGDLPMDASSSLGWAGWLMIPTSCLFWLSAILQASVAAKAAAAGRGPDAGHKEAVITSVSTVSASSGREKASA